MTAEELLPWQPGEANGVGSPSDLRDKIDAAITAAHIEGAKAMQERFRPMLRELVMRRAKDNPGSQIDVDQEIDRILSEVMADKLL